MKYLLNNWLQSFAFFSPLKLKYFFTAVLRRFYIASKNLLSKFGFLLVIDFLVVLFFGETIIKALTPTMQPQTAPAGSIIIMLLIEVNWFIFSSFMLLLMRKKGITESITYLKKSFFSYLQLLFLFNLILFFAILLIFSLGITKFPHMPWLLISSYSIVAHLTTFYWLDSPISLKQIFLSLEKAVNFFAYNLPVFIFLLAVVWGFDFSIKAIFSGFSQALNLDAVIFSTKIEPLVKIYPVYLGTLFKLIGCRYLIFFLKNLWLCFIFVWYDQKKGFIYTKSLLNLPTEQEQLL